MKMSVAEIHRGTSLKLNFSFNNDDKNFDDLVSKTFNINDVAEVRFKFTRSYYYISWKKHESVTEAYTVKMNILCQSTEPFPQQVWCYVNFTDWVIIHKPSQSGFGYQQWEAIEISMFVSKVEKISFENLYEDDQFCDFNLITIDNSGSVPVHKTCLIVHSEIFKRMLSTEWKETINGCIKMEGVTLQNLRHLKEYFYLGTLPDDIMAIQPLLLIAKCYMIKNLLTECIVKLAIAVKPEDFHSLQEFAIDNKLPELIQAIIQMTPDKTVLAAHLIEKEKSEVGPPEAKKSKYDENSTSTSSTST